jgi:L-asparaginase
MNTRLLVLYVGGTIGMQMTDRGLAPCKNFPAILTRCLATTPPAAPLPPFEVEEFATPIDSAEASPEDWAAIARHLAARWAEFNGFVVLHGTDTLAFTASALSFMLRDLDKPVIVTGAQVPLGAPASDAIANVVSALRFAARSDLYEVCVAFNGLLLRGNRSTKVSTTDHAAFDSPNCLPLVRHQDDRRACAPALPRPSTGPRFELVAPESGSVQTLRWAPGFAAPTLPSVLALAPRAIVLCCYGAGTLPSLGGKMAEFLSQARAMKVVVVAISQVAHGGLHLGAYAAGASLLDAGVVDGHDMTFEAAYAKLHHLVARGDVAAAIGTAMTSSLAGEVCQQSERRECQSP